MLTKYLSEVIQMKANMDIRERMERHHIPLWELGAKVGKSENTMIRRLRMELPGEEKAVMLAAVEEIVKEREA